METSGRGRIKSFTIIRRAVSEAYEPDVPYVIGLIELDEGPTMMSKVLASDVSTVSIGEPVTVSFERYTEQVCVPVFRINDWSEYGQKTGMRIKFFSHSRYKGVFRQKEQWSLIFWLGASGKKEIIQ